jgi:hypothetical protein
VVREGNIHTCICVLVSTDQLLLQHLSNRIPEKFAFGKKYQVPASMADSPCQRASTVSEIAKSENKAWALCSCRKNTELGVRKPEVRS